MGIANKLFAVSNPLATLIGDPVENFVGTVYSMSFNEALLLTNDVWKGNVAGIPHNCFLIATALDVKRLADTNILENEIVLLRVLEPVALPQDQANIATRVEHNQRKVASEMFSNSPNDGFDPLTQAELQFGGLRCHILGTFYQDADGALCLGSDLENFMATNRLKVYKPRAQALEVIVNHVNPMAREKAVEVAKASGFSGLPSPIVIGTVRYTSSARLHRGSAEPLVKVLIQPSDFLGRRTGVLGMTRTGKSNTVKTMISAVHMAALTDGQKVGQIVFDINGEYANANHQDDGSSIGDLFEEDCVRYRAVDTPGFEDLRTNFYESCNEGINLLNALSKDLHGRDQQDLLQFMQSSLDEPDLSDHSQHNRWAVRRAIFQCILSRAGFKEPARLTVSFPIAKAILDDVSKIPLTPSPVMGGPKGAWASFSIKDATTFFINLRTQNYLEKANQALNKQPQLGLVSSSSGESWADATTEAYLNMLAGLNKNDNGIWSYKAVGLYKEYHSPRRRSDVSKEILNFLLSGKIVILDLSAGPIEVRSVLSERIARHIFDYSVTTMNAGKMPQNLVIYAEEAHNLIGKKDPLTATWPRIAKEGAKARLALVYATQEPSSIHPSILAATENWFVTHLNNDDEIKTLAKFYDFKDFQASLKSAQDVGFARIKTLSAPFVIPAQIDRFTPSELREKYLLLRECDGK
jgi:hypothetical protein